MESEYPGKDKAGKFIKGHQFSTISDEDLDGLIDDYCHHRSMGLDKHSFKGCDYRTIEKNASEYQKEKIRAAESEGWLLWEEAAQNIAFGISATLPNGKFMDAEKCNTTMAIFMIKNKMRSQYGEKQDRELAEIQNNTGPKSIPFTKINPNTGEVESLSIGGRSIRNGI